MYIINTKKVMKTKQTLSILFCIVAVAISVKLEGHHDVVDPDVSRLFSISNSVSFSDSLTLLTLHKTAQRCST